MLAIIAISLMMLTGVIYWASSHIHQGEPWADRICAASYGLCDRPFYLLLAVGAAVVVAFLWRMLKA
jgi:hypothetical protein